MTSEQTMLVTVRTRWSLLFVLLALIGCSAPKEQLTAPRELTAPYETAAGEAVWAVLPLRNESGTSAADPLKISDALVAAADQVRGVRALPMNRTLAALRELELTARFTPADLDRLARHLGAHGLVTGSVTDYDPYTPRLGLALALHQGIGGIIAPTVDPDGLARQVTEEQLQVNTRAPVAVVAETLDGMNQGVQAHVKSYAEGRSDPDSALGWKRYLASMDLFTEFAAWRMVEELVEREWARVAGAGSPDSRID